MEKVTERRARIISDIIDAMILAEEVGGEKSEAIRSHLRRANARICVEFYPDEPTDHLSDLLRDAA